ncbi:putative haloacid dehalogenase-like hydrolase [Rosellinia necatrix]|uniref:Putative haloacid dehalogenase-like hydrolase n=1 Tax=Rosellinia necatrix TaxID=77044 RepID=A0A1W2TQE2_ROSNE|nr:putative haloacid dehalogenase-like hydrolase [Rosellinia necatrix]
MDFCNMDVAGCGLGVVAPEFTDAGDFQKIRERFYKDGVAFIENCDEDRLIAFTKSLGVAVRPRNETTNGTGVSNIRCVPGLAGKGYSSEELFFHTDRSGWDQPPRILATAVKTASAEGGHSLLVDGLQLVKHIRMHEPFLYRLITSSQYSSFKADDGSFKPRPIFDEATGILRIRFDDGIQLSASLIENFPRLRTLIYQNAYATRLSEGQSYVVDNYRFLHGRTSFTGSRELLRILAVPHVAGVGRPGNYRPKKFVLFDVDGTVCRSEELSVDAFYRCISDVADKDISPDNTKVNLHGQTDLSLVKDMLQYHGIDEDKISQLTQEFLRKHPSYLKDSAARGFRSKPCSDMHNTLSWLDSLQTSGSGLEGYLGLLTGNSRPNALLKIEEAGLPTALFDLDISAFGDSCPSRVALFHDSIRHIESKYSSSLNAQDVLLVGDTPLDIECAKKVGCKVLAVATGNYTAEVLKTYDPDFICDTLIEGKQFIKTFLG